MSLLRQDFQEAVDGAQKRLIVQPPEDVRLHLWQIIAGPPMSGKTFQARLYADTLQEKGLSTGRHDVLANDIPSAFVGQAEKTLDDLMAKAKGGVLIIDEPHILANLMNRIFFDALTKAWDEKSCIIVLTGYKHEMENLVKSMPAPLRARWTPEIRETERSFTREECAAFEQDRAGFAARAEQQRQMAARIDEWRRLPEVDVSVKNVAALKTVRFTRKVPAR